LSRDVACRDKRRACRKDRDVRIAQKVFSSAEFDLIKRFRFQGYACDLLKAIEPNIVIPEETRVIGEYFFHSAATQGNVCVRVIVDVSLRYKERLLHGHRTEFLIVRCLIIDGAGRQLKMKTEFGIEVFVGIEANTVTTADVLQWPG